MVSPTLYAAHDGGDRASHAPSRSHSSPEKAAESPALPASEAACLFRQDNSDRAGAGALVRRPPRLHEPFVSPEFAEGLVRATRLDADVSRGSDGDANSWWQQPEGGQLTPQAAPLYTVKAGDGATRSPSNSDVLAALPSPLAPSLKLAKRLAVTAAGCSSVVKSAAINGTAVSKGTDETRRAEYRFQSAAVKALPNTLLPEVETESVMPQQQSRAPSKDLSSLVTEATCSWGQELGKILGQAVPDFAASAVDSGRTTAMSSSLARLGLMTTGLFPQTMHLRFSSPVCVSSVHVRASSVLRLVVQPGEKVSGSGGVGGKAVTVPADSSNGIDIRHGGATSEASAQDIDVDVRDEPSFKNTRSISVIITSGSGAFCSVRRIYALGTHA